MSGSRYLVVALFGLLLPAMPAKAAVAPLRLRSLSVNGDRFADVVVGEPDRNRVVVVLGGSAGFRSVRIEGVHRRDDVGEAARLIGDFNGDGLADLALNAPGRHVAHKTTIYVVLGSRSPRTIHLAGRSSRVIRIVNVPRDDQIPLAPAGDVNGDGLDDLLLGTPNALYVVFGSRTGRNVSLKALGDRGWKLRARGGDVDSYLTALGDVNADGYADIGLDHEVVLGGPTAPTAKSRRVAIEGTDPDAGTTLGPAGDINGDGIADLLVSNQNNQSVWLVQGGRYFGTLPVQTSRLGYLDAVDELGPTGVGDFNGDGWSDVLLNDQDQAVDVDFNGPDFWHRSHHKVSGLRIRSRPRSSANGFDQPEGTWVGDVNGDGRADVLVQRGNASWLVFGRAKGGLLDTAHLGSAGIRLP